MGFLSHDPFIVAVGGGGGGGRGCCIARTATKPAMIDDRHGLERPRLLFLFAGGMGHVVEGGTGGPSTCQPGAGGGHHRVGSGRSRGACGPAGLAWVSLTGCDAAAVWRWFVPRRRNELPVSW